MITAPRPRSHRSGGRPGQGFFIIFRLYGTGRAYYEGTWRLGDLQKANP